MKEKMRLGWVGLMAVALVLIIAGSGISAEKKLLKMGYIAPVKAWESYAKNYAEQVAKRAPSLDVKWYGGGQLGKNKQMLAALKRGQMELKLLGISSISMAAGAKDFNVLWAPFLFKSQEHLRKYVDSDLFKSMIAKTEKAAGIKFVGYLGDRAPRMLTTGNRRVVKPEDLKGLKLRVPMVTPTKTFFEELGANPTPISGSELYMALKQGVVDGQENGWDAILGGQLYEVQKYVTKTNYVYQSMIVIASQKAWDKLSAEEQKALTDAAVATTEIFKGETDAIIAKGESFAKENGLEVIDPDIDAFRKVAAKIINEKLDGKEWPEGLYDKIRMME